MKPYGKVRSNVYEIGHQTISKKSARQTEKPEIEERLINLLDWDEYDWGDLHWIESDSYPPCDCDHCMPVYEESGNGWKKCI